MERCWHGKFTGTGQCPEVGRYGNPEYRLPGENPGMSAAVKFMRAARWCLAHKHSDDRLLDPDGGAAQSPPGGESSGRDRAT